MTYLLSQIFISLLLAGVAGVAVGWILKGLRAYKREREFQGAIDQQATLLAQSQQERQMIADDYDEMKLSLESRIGELQYDARRMPELEENLEKSQQVVQHMMKTHASEINDLSSQNSGLQAELNELKRLQQNSDSEVSALKKVNAELGGKQGDDAAKNKQTKSRHDAETADQTSHSSSQDLKESNKSEQTTSTWASEVNAAAEPATDETADAELSQGESDENIASTHIASTHSGKQQRNPTENSAISGSADDGSDQDFPDEPEDWQLESVLGDSTVDQSELFALESEIEDMRSLDHGESEVFDAVNADTASLPSLQDSLNDPKLDSAAEHKSIQADDNTENAEANSLNFTVTHDEALDDLQTIHGIGPVIEKSLNEIGITSYQQIAALTRVEIEEIAGILEIFPGRIERDNWIGSARRLISDNQSESADKGEREAADRLENA